MYKEHFGFRDSPFSLTPNTKFFVEARTHREALNVLNVALSNQEGFIQCQLQQGIIFSCEIRALDEMSTVAGYRGDPLLSLGAKAIVYHASAGVPRLINVLCHRALLTAYGRGDRRTEREHVKAAMRDTRELPKLALLQRIGLHAA
jgi:type II secretory pathway predicted ATPase ExeA